MILKKTDVCVIGSGIAGLIATLECAKFSNVLLITKNKLSESNSIYAQGGIAAPISSLDSPKKHFDDTMQAGCFHNNTQSVDLLTKHATQAINDLINYGVKFDKKNNKLDLAKEGAHCIARVLHNKDTTGLEIISKLVHQIRTTPNITILENTTVTELIVKDKTCFGCYANNATNSYRIQAKSTCLTTGGMGYLFGKTSNPTIASGDGLYLAYNAGCRLVDLEFIQFHPTGLNIAESNYFLISEALRGKGAKLINSNGEYFMANYHKNKELAPRDIVARAIFQEIKENRQVFLDCNCINNFQELFPSIYNKANEYNIILPQDLLPVTPVVHYMMGGILTNSHSQTDVKSLYAIGEVACNGLHGANRLASNSLLEGVVFSKLASSHIKKNIHNINWHEINIKPDPNQSHSTKFITSIQDNLWKTCGIIRSTNDLNYISNHFKQELNHGLDIKQNQKKQWLTLAFLISNAAAHRKENLGSHFTNTKQSNEPYWITQKKDAPLEKHTQFPQLQL